MRKKKNLKQNKKHPTIQQTKQKIEDINCNLPREG